MSIYEFNEINSKKPGRITVIPGIISLLNTNKLVLQNDPDKKNFIKRTGALIEEVQGHKSKGLCYL